jgi:hypothetical protein
MISLSKGWLAYLDLRLGPSLEARDFDPTNPGYAFPRWKISR